ncbi:MAG: SH3 domain-containing protein [Chloroflexi bacterium]|nr:SH3 domain-containing protein [Chloroflexota bacterium]
MRCLVLLCLFILIHVAPLSQAQDYELPPCSSKDSRVVHDTVSSPYLELGKSYESLSTHQGLIDFGDRHLQLRDEILPQMSLCAEHLEIDWYISQLADDTLVAFALDRFGVPFEINPLGKSLPDTIRHTSELLVDDLIALNEGRRPANRSKGADSCSHADIERLHSALIPEFRQLVESSIDSSNVDEVLDFVEKVVAFRDMLWQELPRCEEGLELGLMMRQIVSDSVSSYALEYAGVKAEDIPYRQAIQAGMDAFASRSNDLIEKRDGAEAGIALQAQGGEGIPLMRVYGSHLPACSVFQGSLLTIRLALPHQAVVTRASELESTDDLLAFAEEEVDQRIWSMVPHCAEAVETSWFVGQVAGDFAAALAMELAGVPADANPYRQPAERGAERFAKIQAHVQIKGWSDPLAKEDGLLEACSAAELAAMNRVAWDFSEFLIGPALKIETEQQLIDYGNAHVDWREGFWGRMPACLESVKLGVLMGEMASEFTPAFALRLTGIETDDNPYMLKALAHFAAFVDETIMKVISDEADSAPKTYYVTANPYVNIRSCAATSCEIVGSARRGEAITVIDDSGEWYEVQMENGESAFIAGFLASTKPPDD